MTAKPLLFAFLSLSAAFSALGQEKARSCKDIADSKEFWESVRILPPVTITDYDGLTVQYSFSTDKAVYVSRMELYEDADLPAGFADKAIWKQKGKRWWICYCALDRRVFFIQDVELNERILKRSKKVG